MKTLSERISARFGEKPVRPGKSVRSVVLALRAEIQGALDDGWSVLAIYETLSEEGAVSFSYQSFRLYVNQLVLGKISPPSSRRSTKSSASRKTSAKALDSTPGKGALL